MKYNVSDESCTNSIHCVDGYFCVSVYNVTTIKTKLERMFVVVERNCDRIHRVAAARKS